MDGNSSARATADPAETQRQLLVARYRESAEAKGEAARAAIRAGDVGLARRVAREAAQSAHMAMQLEVQTPTLV